MRWTRLSLLPLAISLMGCSGGGAAESATNTRADQPMQVATGGNDADADKAAATTPANHDRRQALSSKGGQYQLLGIKDPDFGIMAAAMKIPRGWLAKQSFQREWNGALPTDKIYVVFRSPDAKQQVEYFPVSQYVYSDGPEPNHLRMQKQSMGLDPRMAENKLPPMRALAYLKRYVLPQMAQHGVTLHDIDKGRETTPHGEPTPGSDKPHMASSASVDGVLPNGNQARVGVRIGWYEARNNHDVYYSWCANPSITQTGSGDLVATYGQLAAKNRPGPNRTY